MKEENVLKTILIGAITTIVGGIVLLSIEQFIVLNHIHDEDIMKNIIGCWALESDKEFIFSVYKFQKDNICQTKALVFPSPLLCGRMQSQFKINDYKVYLKETVWKIVDYSFDTFNVYSETQDTHFKLKRISSTEFNDFHVDTNGKKDYCEGDLSKMIETVNKFFNSKMQPSSVPEK